MGHQKKSSNRLKAKSILRLPDLEQSKNAVLNSLAAASSQESYGHAIDEFISWYCSEPRLAFNRGVVLRYRFFLEQKNLAPSTINVRLAAEHREKINRPTPHAFLTRGVGCSGGSYFRVQTGDEGGISMGSAGTSVFTDTWGQLNPLKIKATFCEY
jgi:hypothetical protein